MGCTSSLQEGVAEEILVKTMSCLEIVDIEVGFGEFQLWFLEIELVWNCRVFGFQDEQCARGQSMPQVDGNWNHF
jgi:hypothetical protein